jgi:hypothetical protein
MKSKFAFLWLGLAITLVMSVVAQSPISDKLTVTFNNPVIVGSQRLAPGEYTIRQLSSSSNPRVLEFSTDNGTKLQATVSAAPALRNNTASETSVVLEQVAGDWYLRKIWIEGKNYGYEFAPSDTGATREASTRTGQTMQLNAQYQPGSGTSTTASTTTTRTDTTTTTTDQTATDRAAQDRADQERAAQERAAQERAAQDRAAQDRAAQERADQERAAQERAAQERAAQDRAAQDRAAQDRTTTEMAQNTQSGQTGDTTGTGTTSRRRGNRTSTDTTGTTDTTGRGSGMPATAGNWMTLLLSGLSMAGAGSMLRARRR